VDETISVAGVAVDFAAGLRREFGGVSLHDGYGGS
jgi:hypothetical protein